MKSPSIRMTLLSAVLVSFSSVSIPLWAGSGKPQANSRPILTAGETDAVVVTAETNEELRTLALSVSQGAEQFEAKATQHEAMLEAYRRTHGGRTIDHCELQAQSDRLMAGAFREMAAAYNDLAGPESKK